MTSSGFVSPATRAFRWVAGEAPTLIGSLPGDTEQSAAENISYDGSVIVGYGSSAGGLEAMRWTDGSGMEGLGDLPGGEFFGSAYGTSDDGKVIIGDSRSDTAPQSGEPEPFVWTPNAGIRRLVTVFTDAGVANVGDWQLWKVEGVSGDGSIFWGWGFLGAKVRYWYVDLGNPPGEPGGAVTIQGYVDGVWSEADSWSGGVVPMPTDHWLHDAPGGDGVHTAMMHGAEEIQDFTWTSPDTMYIWGWPQNWRLGNLIVNGRFRLGAGAVYAQHWDPRVIFNGPVVLEGGTIGNTDGPSEGGEYVFADDSGLRIAGATWVFGPQYDPEHSQYTAFKTAVTWGTGSIELFGIGEANLFTVRMLGDTQLTGNGKNVITRHITGQGGLRKTGPGKFILQAEHNSTPLVYDYEGGTHIEEGEFQCDGVLVNSQVEVVEGAKVSGSGTVWGLVGEGEIGGSLTVSDRFAPNDSSNGQLTFTGTSLTLHGQVRMDLVAGIPEVSDRVTSTVGGTLVLDGATSAIGGDNLSVGTVYPLFTGFDNVVGVLEGISDGTVLTSPLWESQGFAIRINYPGDGIVATIVSPPVAGGFEEYAAALPEGQRGIADNADGDEWQNIFDYLLGLDATVVDGEVVALTPYQEAGDQCMTIGFPFDPDVSDAGLAIEKTGDFTTWETVWDSSQDPDFQSDAILATEEKGGSFNVTVKICPVGEGSFYFIRFRGTTIE